MKILVFSLIQLAALSVLAAGQCENYAKYGAIRAYKAEFGTVQGSDGIQYSAKLVGESGDEEEYVVSISDNNEDGETWTISYLVKTVFRSGKCQLQGRAIKLESGAFSL